MLSGMKYVWVRLSIWCHPICFALYKAPDSISSNSSNIFIVGSTVVAIRGFTQKAEVAGERRTKVTISHSRSIVWMYLPASVEFHAYQRQNHPVTEQSFGINGIYISFKTLHVSINC